MPLSADPRYPRKTATVHGRTMAYVDQGAGAPIVFLHGNPTSSYLWRNVMPHLEGRGRLIAPDLIGMGGSDKLADSGPDRYTFADHRHYLDGLFDHLDLGDRVAFVLHDWGTALGFDWARRHPGRVRAIAHMEGIVMPIDWADFPEAARPVFEGFRSPAGEDMVLDKNTFVDTVLPGSILRSLTEEEMAHYRKPFAEPGEGRRPTLTWPRQIPIDGQPPEMVATVQAYADWLGTSADLPKLFINAEPGAILIGRQREFARSWPNQQEVTVKGIHFLQEDSPDEIGQAVAAFLDRVGP